jgi:hypothetical protein
MVHVNPPLTVCFVEVTGIAIVRVHCENCHEEFGFRMERSASASAQSTEVHWLFIYYEETKKLAIDRAEKKLHHKLMHELDAVPCPTCGRYQPVMVSLLRRNYQRWMRVFGLLAFVACGILLGLYFLVSLAESYTTERLAQMRALLTGAIIFAAVAMSLFATRWAARARYDPNDPRDRVHRLQLAKSRAIPKEALGVLVPPGGSRNAKMLSQSVLRRDY